MAKMNELSILIEEAEYILTRYDSHIAEADWEQDTVLIEYLQESAITLLRDLTTLVKG